MEALSLHLLRAYVWLRVAAAPFLLGVLLGAAAYALAPGPVGIVVGTLLCLLGAFAGVRLANRARREGRLVELAAGTKPASGPKER